MHHRAFLLGLALLTGCTSVQTQGPAQAGRHAYTHPHELRFATSEDITGLNPMFANQAVVGYLAQLTMAYLITADENSVASVPELATVVPTQANGGISADGKTITYHLRHGVKWSDGAPFDADDVVFSTQQVLNPKNNVISRDGWDLITKVDELDKYTVAFHLSKPYSSYAYTFFSAAGSNPAILPKHLLAGRAELNDAPYNALPVGIGPFKYLSWKRSDSVVMVANPNYWRGIPKLQRIVYKLIPDRDTTVTQLQTHEIDLWMPVTPHYAARVKAIDGVTLRKIPSFTYDHLDFNVSHAIVADRAVREALRYAYPRKEIIDKIAFGLFELGESPVTSANVQYHDPIPLIPFDLAKANQILDAAGWKRGADGIRSKNGLRLSLDFAAANGTPDAEAGREILRAAWKSVGCGDRGQDITPRRCSLGRRKPAASSTAASSTWWALHGAAIRMRISPTSTPAIVSRPTARTCRAGATRRRPRRWIARRTTIMPPLAKRTSPSCSRPSLTTSPLSSSITGSSCSRTTAT